MKKVLLSFYLLLTAALLLLPVPGGAYEAKTQPSAARPAFPAPAALSINEKAQTVSQPQEKMSEKNSHGELTRLYAPSVPGLSATCAKQENAPSMTPGMRTANIPPEKISPEGSYMPLLEEELLAAINTRRTEEEGLPLKTDGALQRCARLRAKEMVQSGCFSHTRPDGSPWSSALPDPETLSCPLRGEIFGNALGISPQRAAASWLEEWDKSPSERENIRLPEFNAVGIGAYSCMEDGKTRICAVLLFSGDGTEKSSLSLPIRQ